MKQIILASGNKGKLKELQKTLGCKGIEFIPQSEHAVPEAEENGLSFVENAIIKAEEKAPNLMPSCPRNSEPFPPNGILCETLTTMKYNTNAVKADDMTEMKLVETAFSADIPKRLPTRIANLPIITKKGVPGG